MDFVLFTVPVVKCFVVVLYQNDSYKWAFSIIDFPFKWKLMTKINLWNLMVLILPNSLFLCKAVRKYVDLMGSLKNSIETCCSILQIIIAYDLNYYYYYYFTFSCIPNYTKHQDGMKNKKKGYWQSNRKYNYSTTSISDNSWIVSWH